MASSNRNVTLTGLARRFVEDGLLDEETAKDAFIQASQNRIPLITYLTQNQLADRYCTTCHKFVAIIAMAGSW